MFVVVLLLSENTRLIHLKNGFKTKHASYLVRKSDVLKTNQTLFLESAPENQKTKQVLGFIQMYYSYFLYFRYYRTFLMFHFEHEVLVLDV